MEIKRLFFGFEVIAPWPESFPKGRILASEDRHITLAFLGNENLPNLETLLPTFPIPPFFIGIAGIFDHLVFLPPKTSRVAAWHVDWLGGEEIFLSYQKSILEWLRVKGIHHKEKRGEYLPHVTMARRPFLRKDWKKAFHKLPMYIKNIHLCESLGHSHYEVCWMHQILSPFDEIEHTADIAFLVRGSDISQLYQHAALALSFHFPPLVEYFSDKRVHSLDEVIYALNQMVSKADAEQGCPFKAVSYHGELKKGELLEWEMVVDV